MAILTTILTNSWKFNNWFFRAHASWFQHMIGLFIPQRLENATNQSILSPRSDLLNTYQLTTGDKPYSDSEVCLRSAKIFRGSVILGHRLQSSMEITTSCTSHYRTVSILLVVCSGLEETCSTPENTLHPVCWIAQKAGLWLGPRTSSVCL